MTDCSLWIIGLISTIILIYFLSQYVLNEKHIHAIKYTIYVAIIMMLSVIMIPVFLIRPRHVCNIRLASKILNLLFTVFGVKYHVKNARVLDKDGPCVIVANHQSSIDFVGMMQLWPDHIRHCTILAKKELFWALPFGFTAWLAGIEYVDRNSRERASETMRQLTKKVQDESLRIWIFPEGTRNMNGSMLPFKFGAFRLAIEAQVPIVPVVFSCYEKIYNVEKATQSYYWRRGDVTMECLEPIETKGMTIENDLQRLTDLTRQRMIEVYEKTCTAIYQDKKDN